MARKLFAAKREKAAAISIQKYVRMWLLKNAYTKLSLAALVIQSNIRGFSTRQKFVHGKKHKAATIIQVSSVLLMFMSYLRENIFLLMVFFRELVPL